jgi:hypothetical protein
MGTTAVSAAAAAAAGTGYDSAAAVDIVCSPSKRMTPAKRGGRGGHAARLTAGSGSDSDGDNDNKDGNTGSNAAGGLSFISAFASSSAVPSAAASFNADFAAVPLPERFDAAATAAVSSTDAIITPTDSVQAQAESQLLVETVAQVLAAAQQQRDAGAIALPPAASAVHSAEPASPAVPATTVASVGKPSWPTAAAAAAVAVAATTVVAESETESGRSPTPLAAADNAAVSAPVPEPLAVSRVISNPATDFAHVILNSDLPHGTVLSSLRGPLPLPDTDTEAATVVATFGYAPTAHGSAPTVTEPGWLACGYVYPPRAQIHLHNTIYAELAAMTRAHPAPALTWAHYYALPLALRPLLRTLIPGLARCAPIIEARARDVGLTTEALPVLARQVLGLERVASVMCVRELTLGPGGEGSLVAAGTLIDFRDLPAFPEPIPADEPVLFCFNAGADTPDAAPAAPVGPETLRCLPGLPHSAPESTHTDAAVQYYADILARAHSVHTRVYGVTCRHAALLRAVDRRNPAPGLAPAADAVSGDPRVRATLVARGAAAAAEAAWRSHWPTQVFTCPRPLTSAPTVAHVRALLAASARAPPRFLPLPGDLADASSRAINSVTQFCSVLYHRGRDALHSGSAHERHACLTEINQLWRGYAYAWRCRGRADFGDCVRFRDHFTRSRSVTSARTLVVGTGVVPALQQVIPDIEHMSESLRGLAWMRLFTLPAARASAGRRRARQDARAAARAAAEARRAAARARRTEREAAYAAARTAAAGVDVDGDCDSVGTPGALSSGSESECDTGAAGPGARAGGYADADYDDDVSDVEAEAAATAEAAAAANAAAHLNWEPFSFTAAIMDIAASPATPPAWTQQCTPADADVWLDSLIAQRRRLPNLAVAIDVDAPEWVHRLSHDRVLVAEELYNRAALQRLDLSTADVALRVFDYASLNTELGVYTSHENTTSAMLTCLDIAAKVYDRNMLSRVPRLSGDAPPLLRLEQLVFDSVGHSVLLPPHGEIIEKALCVQPLTLPLLGRAGLAALRSRYAGRVLLQLYDAEAAARARAVIDAERPAVNERLNHAWITRSRDVTFEEPNPWDTRQLGVEGWLHRRVGAAVDRVIAAVSHGIPEAFPPPLDTQLISADALATRATADDVIAGVVVALHAVTTQPFAATPNQAPVFPAVPLAAALSDMHAATNATDADAAGVGADADVQTAEARLTLRTPSLRSLLRAVTAMAGVTHATAEAAVAAEEEADAALSAVVPAASLAVAAPRALCPATAPDDFSWRIDPASPLADVIARSVERRVADDALFFARIGSLHRRAVAAQPTVLAVAALLCAMQRLDIDAAPWVRGYLTLHSAPLLDILAERDQILSMYLALYPGARVSRRFTVCADVVAFIDLDADVEADNSATPPTPHVAAAAAGGAGTTPASSPRAGDTGVTPWSGLTGGQEQLDVYAADTTAGAPLPALDVPVVRERPLMVPWPHDFWN